jgi:endonuclease III
MSTSTLTTSKGKKIPRSPYNLLQEIYIQDPWKILVCCIFLNQTTRKQVDKIRDHFFQKWQSPEDLSQANLEEVIDMIRPLGFYNRRAKTLVEMSRQWVENDWKAPTELKGVGKYANDSWTIFVEGKLVENPSDHILNDYVQWRTKLK